MEVPYDYQYYELTESAPGGQALQDALRLLMERHFTGPQCQGMCGGDPTMGTVQAPTGRIAAETGAPSANTRTMMDQARAAAEEITRDIAAVMESDVAPYRTALLAAGYTPFGGNR